MKSLRYLLVFVLLPPVTGAARAADVDPLLPYVPLPTNAIVVLRVGEILATDRAKAEGWQEPENFLSGAVRIPPWIPLVVQATRINPAGGRPAWGAAVAPVPPQIPLEKIAEAQHSQLQDLAGHRAFRSPRGYFIELKPGLIGVMRTGSRQDAALWVVQADRGVGGMSAYLADAARAPGHLTLAFDATNMVDPQGVRAQVSMSEALQGKPVEIDAAVRMLPGLRGMRATLNFGATTEAEIRLDFSEEVRGLAPTIKALFVEFMNDHGAFLPELSGAVATGEGTSVVLRTPVSDESLRKLVTLVAAPTPEPNVPSGPPVPMPPAGTNPATPAATSNAAAQSIAYYKEVARLIHDLKSLLRNANDYQKSATWHDNFARRIDEMSVVGVDPALAAFGADTSANLRALAASLRGTPVKVGVIGQQVTYDIDIHTDYPTGYKYGAFGGYVPGPGELKTNAQQVRAAQIAAVAEGAADRDKIWQNITAEQNQVRNAMSTKYGIDFDKGK